VGHNHSFTSPQEAVEHSKKEINRLRLLAGSRSTTSELERLPTKTTPRLLRGLLDSRSTGEELRWQERPLHERRNVPQLDYETVEWRERQAYHLLFLVVERFERNDKQATVAAWRSTMREAVLEEGFSSPTKAFSSPRKEEAGGGWRGLRSPVPMGGASKIPVAEFLGARGAGEASPGQARSHPAPTLIGLASFVPTRSVDEIIKEEEWRGAAAVNGGAAGRLGYARESPEEWVSPEQKARLRGMRARVGLDEPSMSKVRHRLHFSLYYSLYIWEQTEIPTVPG